MVGRGTFQATLFVRPSLIAPKMGSLYSFYRFWPDFSPISINFSHIMMKSIFFGVELDPVLVKMIQFHEGNLESWPLLWSFWLVEQKLVVPLQLRSQKCPKWVLKPPNLLPIELVSACAPKGGFIPKMRKMGSLTYPPSDGKFRKIKIFRAITKY